MYGATGGQFIELYAPSSLKVAVSIYKCDLFGPSEGITITFEGEGGAYSGGETEVCVI